jgi:predicted ATPase
LVRRERQQCHTRIAQVLEEGFPEIAETQPELLAYHYTEAGLAAQALPYWQRAGQRAVERSANVEAISHFTHALALLKTLPAMPERIQQELTVQLALGPPLRMIKGHATPAVEAVYTRVYELAQQVEDTQQQCAALMNLSRLYLNQARVQQAYGVAEQCITLAQHVHQPALLLETYRMSGQTSYWLGDFVTARRRLEEGLALYDAHQGHGRAFGSTIDPGVVCLSGLACTLWILGYPDRALARSREALILAQELSHAYSLTFALNYATTVHVWRREVPCAKERAEAVMTLANTQGFIHALSVAMIRRGWALAEQGRVAEGIEQLHQGLATERETGAALSLPYYLSLLAEAYRRGGQVEAGLHTLAEALAHVDTTGERRLEAELHRLTGEFLLAQTDKRCQEREAEECFHQALALARRQQAKALELRAAMSLARLWQPQGKRAEAYALLAPIYGWFTEGFDTADLQDAQALLEELTG